MTTTVTDAPTRSRFEIEVDGKLAGFAAYQRTSDLVVFTHTEIDVSYEGQGLGSALVRGALDVVRTTGLAVLPVCPFVKGWIGRHPDYVDLVYRAPRSQVAD